jgi:hypothetical protein
LAAEWKAAITAINPAIAEHVFVAGSVVPRLYSLKRPETKQGGASTLALGRW